MYSNIKILILFIFLFSSYSRDFYISDNFAECNPDDKYGAFVKLNFRKYFTELNDHVDPH